jgi:hypothetical protein
VWSLQVSGDRLLVGGAFTKIGGIAQRGFARFTIAP